MLFFQITRNEVVFELPRTSYAMRAKPPDGAVANVPARFAGSRAIIARMHTWISPLLGNRNYVERASSGYYVGWVSFMNRDKGVNYTPA